MCNVLMWALYARVSVEQVAVGRKCVLGEEYSESLVTFQVDHQRWFEVRAEQLLGLSTWCAVINNWRLHLFFWKICWIFVQLCSRLCKHLPSCSSRQSGNCSPAPPPSGEHKFPPLRAHAPHEDPDWVEMHLEVNQIELSLLLCNYTFSYCPPLGNPVTTSPIPPILTPSGTSQLIGVHTPYVHTRGKGVC